MSIEQRLPFLAALLIEGSISDQEVQELLNLPLTQFLPITDERQANAIIQSIHCKYSRTMYRPESFSVSKVRSNLFEIKYERNTREKEWNVATTQYLICNREREAEATFITSHIAIGEESALQIESIGEPTPAGKSALYKISGIHRDVDGIEDFVTELFLPMQTKAPLLRTPDGVSIEALLAIVADQLKGLQQGPYPCAENAIALYHVNLALGSLKGRIQARIVQKVKGLQAPHITPTEEDVLREETLSRSIYMVIKDQGAEYRRLIPLYKEIICQLITSVKGDKTPDLYLVESLANALDTCQIPRKGPELDKAYSQVIDPTILAIEKARNLISTVTIGEVEHARNRALRGFTISD